MRIVILLTLIVPLLFAPDGGKPEKPAQAPPIKIGLFVSTSGPIADFGLSAKNGVELAVKQINEGGGVNGQKLEIVFYDTAGKPEEAANAAKRLVHDDVNVAIGAVASALCLSAAPVFQEADIPMVTPSGTNPSVTKQGDMIFRACFMDEFQAKALAHYAQNDLAAKKVAILSNQDDPYSTGLATFFKAKIEDLGATVVAEETYKFGNADFSVQARNIDASGADLLFAPIFYPDVPLVAAELKELESEIQLLGGDGWESEQLLKEDAELDGAIFGTHFHGDVSDHAKAFVKAYEDEYDEAPGSLAALGFDTLYLVVKAIHEADSLEGKKLRDALADIENFDGVTGEDQRMDEDRNIVKPLVLVKIEEGEFKHAGNVTSDDLEPAEEDLDD